MLLRRFSPLFTVAFAFRAVAPTPLGGWGRGRYGWIPLILRMSGDPSHLQFEAFDQKLRPLVFRLASFLASVRIFSRSGQTLDFTEIPYSDFGRKVESGRCARVDV